MHGTTIKVTRMRLQASTATKYDNILHTSLEWNSEL